MSIIITTVLLAVLSFIIAYFTKTSFYDWTFIVGLAGIIIIRYFTSSGGFTSNLFRLEIQAQTGIKIEEEEGRFQPSVAYYTAIGYTLISVILTLIKYWDAITK
jgi:hypothetical protein